MTHPTQFDGPLFSQIARTAPFELSVYYLDTDCIARKVDGELGFSPNWDIPTTDGYRSFPCPRGFTSRLRFLRRECFAAGKYDLVIVPGYSQLEVTLLAALTRRPDLGMRLDTVPLYSEPAWKSWCRRAILKRLFRRFATFHPVGSLTESFLAEMGISSARTFRFPYAVDNEYLSSRSKGYRGSRGQLLRELGLGPEAFVVLGVLKFVPRENPLELLCGFGRFHEEVPHSALILVGAGALRGELEASIQAKKLAECVRLVGYARYSELPKWYAMADVFVHPALWECWGVSVNEAMACGLPVIASDRVGSSYDLLREGLNGYRYPSGDPAALARCLGKIASLPDRGRALGEASRRLIAGWSYEATIAFLRAAVEKVRGGSLAGESSFRAEVHGR